MNSLIDTRAKQSSPTLVSIIEDTETYVESPDLNITYFEDQLDSTNPCYAEDHFLV
jgi:hypothetical protein